jgi:hypothetical protein
VGKRRSGLIRAVIARLLGDLALPSLQASETERDAAYRIGLARKQLADWSE